MITNYQEVRKFLDELVEKYYSEEEYTLELELINTSLFKLTCKTDYRDFEPELIYLPLLETDFEEEVARLANTAQWALSPVIEPNIKIEGL